MSNEQLFYDLIYIKKDTIENAKKVIENIKTEKNYKTVLTRCVGYTSKVILRLVIEEPTFENFKSKIKNDTTKHSGAKLETMKERLINSSLQNGDKDVFELICGLFDVQDVIPKYELLSDIIYQPQYYDDDFINTKTNVYYLTDIESNMRHFENVITDMRNVYYAGCDLVLQKQNKESKYETKDAFDKLLKCFKFTLNEDEIEHIKKFSISYYDFMENHFDNVIYDIKQNEENPDSKTDCWGLLYEYLGRDPSDWERDILWDHTCDWACDDDDEDFEA